MRLIRVIYAFFLANFLFLCITPNEAKAGVEVDCEGTLQAWRNDISLRDYMATHDCHCPSAYAQPICTEKFVVSSPAGGYSGGSQDMQRQMIQGTLQPFFNNAFALPDTSVQDEIARQNTIKQQQEKEQKKKAAIQRWLLLQKEEDLRRKMKDANNAERGKELLAKMKTVGGGSISPFKGDRESDVNTLESKLKQCREELYRIQAEQQKITECFGDITREFSAIGTETQEIINDNIEKIPETVLDGTMTFNRSEVMENIKDIIKDVDSYSKIKDTDDLIELGKKTVGYIGQVSKYFEALDWAINISESGWDIRKEFIFIKRIPELELECRALVLDMENNSVRRKELIKEIESLRERIHEVSGKPLAQIEVTPLRPWGGYVPKFYPTIESLNKVRQDAKPATN